MAALLLSAACQPAPVAGQAFPCPQEAPDEAVAGPVVCDAQQIAGGEGRSADYWIASPWLRAVVRHPQSALTVPGAGGATVIDAAPWGAGDVLHEVLPLVDDGWIDVVEFEVLDDGIRAAGPVVPLADRPASAPGAWREVVWRADPEGPWLHAEGADGLYVHPAVDAELLGEALWSDEVVIGLGGPAESLGGALRTDSPTLLLAPPATAPQWLGEPTEPLAGTAPGADQLGLYDEGARVGTVPVGDDGAFDLRVPLLWDAVRAEAAGHAPSETTLLGDDLELALGPEGNLRLQPAWAGVRPRPLHVTWSDRAGRAGTTLLDPDGGVLELGAGEYTLAIAAGPDLEPLSRTVSVLPGDEAALGLALQARFDPGDRILAAPTWPGSRSRTFLGTDRTALRAAVAAGVEFAVITPEDDVASASTALEERPWLRARDGALLTAGQPWRIAAWPWSASNRRNAHGAVDARDLSPEDALAAAWGGAASSRFTLVDGPWLAAAGAPWTTLPRPDFARLAGPGPTAWGDWFTWLDAGVDLVPVGPRVWVEVVDRDLWGIEDAEYGLVRGKVTATTGGLVTLSVAGTGPGEIVPPEVVAPPGDRPAPAWGEPPAAGPPFVVQAMPAAEPWDHLAVIGDGGAVLARTSGDASSWTGRLPADITWAVAAAWTDDGTAWAVTGPVWIDPPGRP